MILIKINFYDLIIPKFDNLTKDILSHKHTHYWGVGGRGSTKSSFYALIIVLLIIYKKNTNALILRKVSTTLKDSVFNQILWATDMLGVNDFFKSTISPLEITYTKTGQKIFFRGADDPIKIKSIKPKLGYIAVTWFEELDQFKGEEEIRNILQSANRGGSIFWNFYTFNPPKSKDNWVNTSVDDEYEDKLVTRNNYLDVPISWLGEPFFYEATKLKLKNFRAYEHELLGIATGTGGSVFENIETREITNTEIETFDYFYYGLDFGFAIDPLAFIKVSYNRKLNTLYILDEIYQVKLSNKIAVSKIIDIIGNRALITADSAEPRTISEFKNLGLTITGARKGPDSVAYGMKWLQDLNKIVIDKKRTPNAYKEFTLYEYDTDKNGNYISRYPDKNNHLIDALRYALEEFSKGKTFSFT